ncbi:hypothetical protein CHGG_10569 [Chaetomium globosum CBS 148.51]|uniref:Uncharacterized protein n=1 Tax=Chaetomium globosum (strain ATCC 6205 / CBS 148.51 / DSM 1962 / NBRC 6347 / NRRL 1970) TaxID=306901 RepID=Q2GN85_CHAGB|nr:uncharacterized protein CHGG_10569 [Chaetomium globosum CBS 148.51]EAQ84165.1 hypothetical protein CHGG_10569 [Chaetomium globosum CBS 148.51]
MARRKWYNGPGSTAPPHNSRNSRKSPKAPKTPKSAKIQPMEDLKPEFGGEPAKSPPAHESAPPKRPEKLPLNEHTETRAGPAGLHRQAPPIMEARSPPTSLPNPDSIDAAISGNPRSDQFRAFPTPQVQHPRWHQPWYPSFKVQDALFAAQYAYQDTLAQRLALSRDDMEPLSPQRSPDQDEEDRVQREMESLREQLREANSRADQAERAAEELTRQLRSSRSNEPVMDHNNLADTTTTLKAENSGLKAELDEARSHIFSLQPYRKDLTPKEKQDFDDLVNGITDWVTNFIDPILDDDNKMDDVLAAAKQRPADVQKLKRYLHSQGDLVYGCMFPETDIDILIAVVMRFLQDHIFQKILYGAVPKTVEVISFLEGQMQTNVEPKRDLFALRTWRAEALNAVLCSPDYARSRHGRIKELTTEMALLFKVFRRDKDWNGLCVACQDGIIKPAVALHEKLMTSTHHFYLDLNPYILWNSRQELEMSPDFLDDLHTLRCENILQNRKPFNVAKLDPRPSKEQLYKELNNVATIVPALYMRQVGKGDVIKEPTVVRMQQVLVAWGPEEKRERFLANGQRTLMHQLCFSRRDRGERAQDGGVWPWRGLQWG